MTYQDARRYLPEVVAELEKTQSCYAPLTDEESCQGIPDFGFRKESLVWTGQLTKLGDATVFLISLSRRHQGQSWTCAVLRDIETGVVLSFFGRHQECRSIDFTGIPIRGFPGLEPLITQARLMAEVAG